MEATADPKARPLHQWSHPDLPRRRVTRRRRQPRRVRQMRRLPGWRLDQMVQVGLRSLALTSLICVLSCGEIGRLHDRYDVIHSDLSIDWNVGVQTRALVNPAESVKSRRDCRRQRMGLRDYGGTGRTLQHWRRQLGM